MSEYYILEYKRSKIGKKSHQFDVDKFEKLGTKIVKMLDGRLRDRKEKTVKKGLRMWRSKVNLRQVNPEDGLRYYEEVGIKTPIPMYSVTTIVSETKSERDKSVLDDWKVTFDAKHYDGAHLDYVKERLDQGNKMHEILEDYFHYLSRHPSEEYNMFSDDPYFNQYRKFLDNNYIEPLFIEGKVCWKSPNGEYSFAGTVDLVAKVNGKLCIVDHKSSAKDKSKKQWIGDYLMQVSAYSKAIKVLYDVDIEGAYVNIACGQDNEKFNEKHPYLFRSHFFSPKELASGWKDFYKKMKEFYDF